MRKPKDIDDLGQCIRRRDDILWIYCIECEAWHQVTILAWCNVTFRQVAAPVIDDADQLAYTCSECGCNIGYLLEDSVRQWLIKKMVITNDKGA